MRRFLLVNPSAETAVVGAAIERRLVGRFGKQRVLSSDGASAHGSHRTAPELLSHCAILLLVVGPDFARLAAGAGQGIINPAATQLQLVEVALNDKRITVVPILVHGATMPSPLELPPGLASLAYLQAAPVTLVASDTLSVPDMDRLIRGMLTLLPVRERANYPRYTLAWLPTWLLTILGIILLVVALFLALSNWLSSGFSAGFDTTSLVVLWTGVAVASAGLLLFSVLWGFALVRAYQARRLWWFLGLLVLPMSALLFGLIGPVEPAPVRGRPWQNWRTS